MRKGDRVRIEWLDIHAALHTDEPIEPIRAESVGWIEHQCKQYIRLSTSRYLTGCDYKDTIAIPRGVIVSIDLI